MPTKTDRILSYLPATFRALPKPTALYAVADAFGNELLLAENSLAEIMRAHWVDQADRGAEFIDDLARIAALYGLAPRMPPWPEEDVEGFREHLKRYVRTFLEGTVTVQGILRVTAEALGLRIADDYAAMDTWWTRLNDALVTVEPRGEDAARLLFGVRAATVASQPARPAWVTGRVDLSGTVDLQGAAVLRVKLDAAAPVDIDCAGSTTLAQIVEKINAAFEPDIASHDGRFLTLTSPTVGPSSRLEVHDVADDAAARLLGLPPRAYQGAGATSAQVIGERDLSAGLGLGDTRYLRLLIDGIHLAEVDCGGATTLDQAVAAINAAFEPDIASHDGHFLALTSPTSGFTSSIAFQPPAAQNAAERLFGPVAPFHSGRDPRSATATGARELGGGVDLSVRSRVRIQVDDQPAVTVDCAGANPARTTLSEIVAALNQALEAGSASHDGRFVRLAAPSAGPASALVFEALSEDEDATELIFGIGPRVFQGVAATRARLAGVPDLSAGVDLRAVHVVRIAVDGGPPLEVDLRDWTSDSTLTPLSRIVDVLNAALGPGVASDNGGHLTLTSPTSGGAGQVAIEPLELTCRRRFVTQALIVDEAARAIFGFVTRQAAGQAATRARVIGQADLSRGVDLREAHFLRIGVDGQPAHDLDFAAVPTSVPRPRAAMLGEIVDAINAKFGSDVAAHDGHHLVLTSPSEGADGRIAFEPPRAADALGRLLGLTPGVFRGRDASQVQFVGMVDLSAGVDLSAADQIEIGVDGAPIEITCSGTDPAHTTLNEIVMAINVALDQVVAGHDGAHLILTSRKTGADSRIEFAAPPGPDATKTLFGITAPRVYQGTAAEVARVVGVEDLAAETDLSVARFLRVVVDGTSREIDCGARTADPAHATREAIVEAINATLAPAGAAALDGARLAIASTAVGQSARIELQPYTNPASDARAKLLGDVPDVTTGDDPTQAIITGEVDLLTPADLAERRAIRLAVDGARAVDIDVAGDAPETTFLDEIVARINTVVPSLASATEDDRLRLTSPTRGENSRLELLPLRALELIEYPPRLFEPPPILARHGDNWLVDNPGAADAELKIELSAPSGAAGPMFVNHTAGQRIRLMVVVSPGERAQVWRDPEAGLRAAIRAADGTRRPVDPAHILAGPLGAQAWVPFDGEWRLSGAVGDEAAMLQLNNPVAPSILVLRARRFGPDGDQIKVRVTEADLAGLGGGPVVADGHTARLVGRVIADSDGYRLVDAGEAMLARLQGGPGVALAAHQNRVVSVQGPLHAGDEAPQMVVEHIAGLFDVTLRGPAGEGEVVESYPGAAIGLGAAMPEDLARQIDTRSSQLVYAAEFDKAAALLLPRGRSEWAYLDCYGARFNRDRFDMAYFPGGVCLERGVFNISRFANSPPEPELAVFASSATPLDPPVEIQLRWSGHQPGAFVVNLPADLPEFFGGRFNEARFGLGDGKAEEYLGVVTEPEDDEDFLVTRLAGSTLVEAQKVDLVPVGWAPISIPIRRPRARTLTGGSESQSARLYLAEPDVPGFVEVRARQPGAWGNAIAVTVRKSGPALFDVTIGYQGGRFEIARQIALGGQLPTLTEELLQPGPVGVLQAKAAGVHVDVTRDGIGANCQTGSYSAEQRS